MDLEFQLGKKGNGRARRSDEGSRRIVVLGDFSGRESRGLVEVGDALASRPLVRVRQEGFDASLAAVAPRLSVAGAAQPLELSALDDFHPDTLFKRLSMFRDAPRAPAPVGVVPVGEAEAEDVARLLGRRPSVPAASAPAPSAADALIGQIMSAHGGPATRAEAPLDAAALGRIMRLVLHDPTFQALEASWRALELLVSRADGEVEIWLLDVSRAELDADLLDDGASDAIEDTGLGRRLLSPPGKRAFSLLVADQFFGSGAEDLALLGRMGRLCAGLGAPLVAGAEPSLVGCRALVGAADPAARAGTRARDVLAPRIRHGLATRRRVDNDRGRIARTTPIRGVDVCDARANASSPPWAPEPPVHVVRGLLALEACLGELLRKRELPIFPVGLLVTDVEAVAAVRVGIPVDDVSVLRLRKELQGGHRAELLDPFRRIGGLRVEPGRRQQVARIPRLAPAHRGAAGEYDRRREHRQDTTRSHRGHARGADSVGARRRAE